MWETLKREPVHALIVLFAAASFLLSLKPSTTPNPWEAEQKVSAQRIESAAAQLDAKQMQGKLSQHPKLAWVILIWTWLGLALLVAGIAALWRMIQRLRRGEPALGQGFSIPLAPWGVWEVVKLFSWILVSTQLLYVAQHFIGRSTGQALDRYAGAAIHTLLLDVIAVGLVAFIVLRPLRISWKNLGLHREQMGRQLAAGVLGYTLWIPVLLATFMVMLTAYEWAGIKPQPQNVVVMLLNETRPKLLLFLSVLVAVIGPIAEEIIFRGVTYGAFRKYLGVRWGLVFSALLFAGLHFDLMSFVPILVLGVMLGWLYEQTGSLVPSMAVHMIHNGAMFLMTMILRELFRVMGTA